MRSLTNTEPGVALKFSMLVKYTSRVDRDVPHLSKPGFRVDR
jgi:hypothetical protein